MAAINPPSSVGGSYLSGIPGSVSGMIMPPTGGSSSPASLASQYGFTLIPSSLANQGAQIIPTSLATSTGPQIISPSWAQALAGTQYNQAIADAQKALQMQQGQNATDMANVGQWWQQILGAQAAASQQGAAIGQNVQGGEQAANAAILASLGGSANPAASSVASAGQSDLGTLQAINAINQAYNANMTPILQMGATGALSLQQQKNNTALQQALQNVQDLTAQKGAAQVQDAFNIAQENNSTRSAQQQALLNIYNANNTTRDNTVQLKENILGANNQILGNVQSLRQNASEWAQSLGLQKAQLSQNQNQFNQSLHLSQQQLDQTQLWDRIGLVLQGAYGPNGMITKEGAQALHQLSGLPVSDFYGGTSATVAGKDITAKEEQWKTIFSEDQQNQRSAASIAARFADEGIIQRGDQSRLTQKLDAPDPSLSKEYGVIVNGLGQTIPGKNGQPQPVAASSTSGALTQSSAMTWAKSVATGTPTKETVTSGTHYVIGPKGTHIADGPNYHNITIPGQGMNFQQAMASAKAAFGSNPAEYGRAVAALKAQPQYSTPGKNGVPYPAGPQGVSVATKQLEIAISNNIPPQQAIQVLQSSGYFPQRTLSIAVRKAFGAAMKVQKQADQHSYGSTTVQLPPQLTG